MQNKQQEFLKQRERLKYVTQNNVDKKILDPDIMIKQLISDKETFKFNVEPQSYYMLPKWLKLQNNLVPTVYEQIWHAVKLNSSNVYCDTKIITQLFTTSGLSLEKLGHLWSLANVSTPGFLTQQELYVILALIALVQAGYSVKDVLILQNINHPILPQLDYTFLNIVVANPAINRNVGKSATHDFKVTNSAPYFDLVPLQSQSTPNFNSNWQQLPQNVNFNIDSYNTNDLICEIPNTNNLIIDFKSLSLEKAVAETKSFVDLKSNTEFIESSVGSEKQSETNELKSYEFLNLPDISSNVEPRSLDLPLFEDDDEFAEFQSAAVVTVLDDYTDFQSASPIAKYDKDNLVIDNGLPVKYEVQNTIAGNNQGSSSLMCNDECNDYKTSAESDKYDVFRSLVEQTEIIDNEEGSDDDDEEEEEEFGEFFAATSVQQETKEKPKISIKEKCLEACLRLLEEGLRIFSKVSNERTLIEILSDEKGYRYFNQLKIVYETSQRFQRKFENSSLSDALQLVWEKLSMYSKYVPSDELLDEMSCEEDLNASVCKLCETKCDINCVRYAGNNYHVACINLFLHFVEDSEISAMLNI